MYIQNQEPQDLGSDQFSSQKVLNPSLAHQNSFEPLPEQVVKPTNQESEGQAKHGINTNFMENELFLLQQKIAGLEQKLTGNFTQKLANFTQNLG